MEYTIRMAQERDGPELARLRWDFRSEGGYEEPAVAEHEFAGAYEAFFRRGLLDRSRGHWITEDGGRIVAHVVVQKVDMVPRPCKLHDRWGYVTDNYTRPAYRNRNRQSAPGGSIHTNTMARPTPIEPVTARVDQLFAQWDTFAFMPRYAGSAATRLRPVTWNKTGTSLLTSCMKSHLNT